jgi:hypothetical protein
VPHSYLKFIEASEEIHMKRFFGYALMLALSTAPTFAAKNAQSVKFAQDMKVGTTQLPAGSYKVTWAGEGPSVQVTLEQNGKAPVTVPAKLVEEKHDRNSYTVNRIGGADQLEVIQLNKVSLVLQNPTASGQ